MVKVHVCFGSAVSWSYLRCDVVSTPTEVQLNSLKYLLCSNLHMVKLI